ncbi:hypothetical protein [Pendulispora albinea]|uniref:Uncharacterized protein n=1 Tax=Pendulispora albinea TaxID=2741071 RepID=A0ABZ2M4W0_9BACT
MNLLRVVGAVGPFALVALASCSSGSGGAGLEGTASKRQALDDDAGQCVVDDGVVEHSCHHASDGPFASTTAQVYPGNVFNDVNAPHTSHTVTLPGTAGQYHGAVLYQPAVSGKFGFFTAPNVPVAIFDSAGNAVAKDNEADVPATACALLNHVTVFSLLETETYRLVFGPAVDASVRVIVESLGAGGCHSCEGADLEASVTHSPYSRTDGKSQLEHPIPFDVPSEIPVISGNAGNHWARLSFAKAGARAVRCYYRGGADVCFPSTPEQIEKGKRYVFEYCDNGLSAGARAEADRFELRVTKSGDRTAKTTADLEIEDATCHGHGHEGAAK